MGIFESDLSFWFVLGLALLIFEVATPGVVALFFGLGAWLVLIVRIFLPLPVWSQWALFSVSSVVFLILLRKHVITLFNSFKTTKKDSLSEPMVARRYLGQEVDVLEDIQPGRPGAVELNGTRWQARTRVPLAKGARARIIELEELMFWIEPLNPD
ncbi:MAG: NfeD family protein [Deltaproteobacteria bacterium]|nr:NfeD family protein [Deltaproteobacteria bacterium]